MTDPGRFILTRSDEISPIRTQLNIRNLRTMRIVDRIHLLSRLHVVLCDFPRFVAGEDGV